MIDGDILELSSGETVRLLGIDCEENKYGPEEAAFANTGKKFKRSPDSVRQAKEAAEFTRKLVEGKQVRLEYDVQKKDKYGRTLAYVYVDIGVVKTLQNVKTGEISSQPAADWIFLNEEIIKRGYAQVMTIPPNVKHAELFVKLEKDARENKRGLWES